MLGIPEFHQVLPIASLEICSGMDQVRPRKAPQLPARWISRIWMPCQKLRAGFGIPMAPILLRLTFPEWFLRVLPSPPVVVNSLCPWKSYYIIIPEPIMVFACILFQVFGVWGENICCPEAGLPSSVRGPQALPLFEKRNNHEKHDSIS